jgi:hypothetical protein
MQDTQIRPPAVENLDWFLSFRLIDRIMISHSCSIGLSQASYILLCVLASPSAVNLTCAIARPLCSAVYPSLSIFVSLSTFSSLFSSLELSYLAYSRLRHFGASSLMHVHVITAIQPCYLTSLSAVEPYLYTLLAKMVIDPRLYAKDWRRYGRHPINFRRS